MRAYCKVSCLCVQSELCIVTIKIFYCGTWCSLLNRRDGNRRTRRLPCFPWRPPSFIQTTTTPLSSEAVEEELDAQGRKSRDFSRPVCWAACSSITRQSFVMNDALGGIINNRFVVGQRVRERRMPEEEPVAAKTKKNRRARRRTQRNLWISLCYLCP